MWADENILYLNDDSGNAIFYCNRMGALNIDLNNINLNDTNYDEDFWLDMLNLKKCKALEKELNDELMSVAWHPKRWWVFCVSGDEKKEIDAIFIEEL